MISSKLLKATFSSSLLLLTGCATIMNGTTQSVSISSNPSNAGVWIDNQFVGQSPMIVMLTRKDNHFVRIELEGYQPYQITFNRELSGWVFGNIVFGGFIGLAVDAISGGIYRLTPEQANANLSQHCTYGKKSADSSIAIVMKIDPSWEKIGELEKI